MRVLLFTDTLADVNGVSRFVTNIADHARATDHDLHVVTSTRFDCPSAPNIHNLRPLAAMKMPGYPNLELALPPRRAMLRLARELRPDAIHVSTPGPVGLLGRAAAMKLGLPLLGVYHTDFPAYIERLFENRMFTCISRACMRRFYRPFAAMFTRSRDYVAALRALGIACPIEPLRPGIRTDQFHPRFRDSSSSRDGDTIHLLYVGRVSVEKNMPLLARVWRETVKALSARGLKAELAIVGDGPYRPAMETALAGTRTRFLGFRYGDELSRLYASSDVFVFPSVTDTLGQVVMEAQASGLPVLVSDQGGPKEVVRHARTGLVLPANDPDAWVTSIVNLCTNGAQRRVMSAEAHEYMQQYSVDASFDHWWRVHEEARQLRVQLSGGDAQPRSSRDRAGRVHPARG